MAAASASDKLEALRVEIKAFRNEQEQAEKRIVELRREIDKTNHKMLEQEAIIYRDTELEKMKKSIARYSPIRSALAEQLRELRNGDGSIKDSDAFSFVLFRAIFCLHEIDNLNKRLAWFAPDEKMKFATWHRWVGMRVDWLRVMGDVLHKRYPDIPGQSGVVVTAAMPDTDVKGPTDAKTFVYQRRAAYVETKIDFAKFGGSAGFDNVDHIGPDREDCNKLRAMIDGKIDVDNLIALLSNEKHSQFTPWWTEVPLPIDA
ncbi:MAG: hypothetical protein Hyperionvirus28_7 [Hyperionvirus sp.]|uniref:Uncharacterized protein n=1 Tax=Hyperionvirus sp. TaxID=2487770 RepID=A0A3G5AGJ5_9VIRU|nr:MAG: hypothetical protein Hyperionvirus28_7 [Hyperionvirus sp.]